MLTHDIVFVISLGWSVCLSVCPLPVQYCILRRWLPLRFDFDCCSTAIRPRDFHSTTYVTNVRSCL